MLKEFREDFFMDAKNHGYVQLIEMLEPQLLKDVPQGDIDFSTTEENVPEDRIQLVEPLFYEVVKTRVDEEEGDFNRGLFSWGGDSESYVMSTPSIYERPRRIGVRACYAV